MKEFIENLRENKLAWDKFRDYLIESHNLFIERFEKDSGVFFEKALIGYLHDFFYNECMPITIGILDHGCFVFNIYDKYGERTVTHLRIAYYSLDRDLIFSNRTDCEFASFLEAFKMLDLDLYLKKQKNS